MIYWTAFTLGLLGSTHCVGMCGPIALALPLSKHQKWAIFKNAFIYNLGRIITYSFLGLLLGLIGQGIEIAGFQQTFSIIAGIFLLVSAFAFTSLESRLIQFPVIANFFSWIKSRMRQLLRKGTPQSNFLIGLLNGLLPCGLVYVAVAGAIVAGSALAGALFMSLFGFGTMPLMLGLIFLGQSIRPSFKTALKKATPVFMALFSILLIMRGINVSFPSELAFLELLKAPLMCH